MAKIGIDARLWNETGVGRYIRNLVAELQKMDKENQYILFALSKDVKNIQFQISNFKFQIKPADVPWHSVSEQIQFPKILKKENLDLVHFPYFSIPIRYNKPYILTIHDLILHHFPTGKASTKSPFVYWFKQMGYRYVLSQAAQHAKKIITVSHATEGEIIDHLHVPKEKIAVTYEGVDKKVTSYKLQVTSLPKRYFLYVGNAYPHKNLETLVKAFAKMINDQRSMINNTKLILVGKEDYFYRKLEQEVKQMGLSDEILFKHSVNDEELGALYQHALATVVPSKMEGFGLSILEAMGKGCLVVCSDIPVFHEIAGEVPLYFSPTNIQELSDVLESIAKGRIKNGQERKEKGKKLAKQFSWGKMAHQTLEVYKGCIGV